jgi:cell wall-associated NlpC family hydrolase
MGICNYILIIVVALCMLHTCVFASYVLQLGTYTPAEAEGLHQQLALRNYPVYLQYGENCELRVGAYSTREEAERVLQKLKTEDKVVATIIEEETMDAPELDANDSEDDSPVAGSDAGREVSTDVVHGYDDPRAREIVSLGLDLFGHPYKYGGEKIGSGIDCSFFVQSIFRHLGISLPRTAREQILTGREVDKQDMKVGDLVFFKKTYRNISKRRHQKRNLGRSWTRINHVGIFIGNGEFIHATINAKRVTISRLDEKYFVEHFAGARRVLSDREQAE